MDACMSPVKLIAQLTATAASLPAQVPWQAFSPLHLMVILYHHNTTHHHNEDNHHGLAETHR